MPYIRSLDCGKKTWADIFRVEENRSQEIETNTIAGELFYDISLRGQRLSAQKNAIRVGPYDSKKMPAAMVFGDFDCRVNAVRLFYDDRVQVPGEYDYRDLSSIVFSGIHEADDKKYMMGVGSIMVRPGYQIKFYKQFGWKEEIEVIRGEYANPDSPTSEKLRCIQTHS